MLAPYALDRDSDGKPMSQSSRWFCGYCVHSACVSWGGNQPAVRERIGEWLARGYGREFLAEMDSHFAKLGPGANHAPIAEHPRRESGRRSRKHNRRTTTSCCGNPGGSHELAGVCCDDYSEGIRLEDDAVEKLGSRTVDHCGCSSASSATSVQLHGIPKLHRHLEQGSGELPPTASCPFFGA